MNVDKILIVYDCYIFRELFWILLFLYINFINGDYKNRKYYLNYFLLVLLFINIKIKEKISSTKKKCINFGLLANLKEINVKNRIDDFIPLCYLKE